MHRMLFSILIIFTIGCALTLEDFYSMSRYKRAELVCRQSENARTRQSEISQLDYEHSRIQAEIRQKEYLLETGYRIHRQCRQVPAKPDSSCVENNECIERAYVEDCVETPIPIDYRYEERKLLDLREELSTTNYLWTEAKVDWELAYNTCYEKAQSLSVKESYGYYERGGEP